MKIPTHNTLKVHASDKDTGGEVGNMVVWWRADAGSSAHRVMNAETGGARFKAVPAAEIVVLAGFTTEIPLYTKRVVMPEEGTHELKMELAVELMGLFDPVKHEEFAPIEPPYRDPAEKRPFLLRKATLAGFKSMHAAALKSKVYLKIVSPTRNFVDQRAIWTAKWTGQRLITVGKGKSRRSINAAKMFDNDLKGRALAILEYSSMPGTSRHHWGTDFDINDTGTDYWGAGRGEDEFEWLSAHAAEHGFAQPYTAGRIGGYSEEKWHWSYTPLAKGYTQRYAEIITNADIQGFAGSETAVAIDMVQNYVLNVAPTCK